MATSLSVVSQNASSASGLSSEIVEATPRAGGEQIHAADSVPPGGAFLGRSGETIESRDDVRSLETSRRERRNELCFQQSAGNSTGPEIDVA